jgi:limonene-1,2-epoxide hydrolase
MFAVPDHSHTAAPLPGHRAIGPIGTAVRVGGGLAAIAVPIVLSGITWWDVGAALLVLPLTAALAASALTWFLSARPRSRRVRPRSLEPWVRSTFVLVIVIAVEVALTYVSPLDGATALFIFFGVSLLIAALRGDAGCEAVAIPNTLAGRRDPAGCVILAPVDAIEARRSLKRNTNAIEAVVGWMDAMRRADLRAAARWFDPEVKWRGIPDGAVCRDREDVIEMLSDSYVSCPEDPREPELEPGLRGAEAVELVAAGPETVVLGAKVAGLSEIGGVPVYGQLFNVFRVRDGRIVDVADYARRAEALAAARAKPPLWR